MSPSFTRNISKYYKMHWGYFLLTAFTFYVVAFVLSVPALGPVPATVVKSLIFVVLHVLAHKYVGPHLRK